MKNTQVSCYHFNDVDWHPWLTFSNLGETSFVICCFWDNLQVTQIERSTLYCFELCGHFWISRVSGMTREHSRLRSLPGDDIGFRLSLNTNNLGLDDISDGWFQDWSNVIRKGCFFARHLIVQVINSCDLIAPDLSIDAVFVLAVLKTHGTYMFLIHQVQTEQRIGICLSLSQT